MSVPSLDLLKNALLVLGVINVYEPIAFSDLRGKVGAKDDDGLQEVLRYLLNRELIRALPNRHYRTTWEGQSKMYSRSLRTSRDVQRMWHLADLSDAIRRENEEGENSQ